MEAIALTETSLARILNAEGEKLEAAIRQNAPPRELLKVNESVRETILSAAKLEQVLLFRMQALSAGPETEGCQTV